MRGFAVGAVILVCTAALSGAQDSRPPAGNHPNPYRTTFKFGTLPEGRTWGGVSAIDIDRDGRSVWVAERCGSQSCANSFLAPILKLDPDGRVVASFGAGMAEGVAVAADGTVYGGVVPAQMVQKHSRAR